MTPPLPRYRCHKEVRALKIKSLMHNPNGTISILPEDDRYAPIDVPKQFVPTHDTARPAEGWYWVKYDNGYESFSPPGPFEDGYTLIEE